MIHKISIFSQRDVKIIIVSTMVGGILQIICCKSIKNYPQIFNHEIKGVNDENLQNSEPEFPLAVPPRGKFFILKIAVKAVIPVIAKRGIFIALFLSSCTRIAGKIPITGTAVTRWVRDALPYSHSDEAKLRAKQLIAIDREDFYLGLCHQNFNFFTMIRYLFTVSKTADLSTEQKKKFIRLILMNYLDPNTIDGVVRVVTILTLFSMIHPPTFLKLSSKSSIVIILKVFYDEFKDKLK